MNLGTAKWASETKPNVISRRTLTQTVSYWCLGDQHITGLRPSWADRILAVRWRCLWDQTQRTSPTDARRRCSDSGC